MGKRDSTTHSDAPSSKKARLSDNEKNESTMPHPSSSNDTQAGNRLDAVTVVEKNSGKESLRLHLLISQTVITDVAPLSSTDDKRISSSFKGCEKKTLNTTLSSSSTTLSVQSIIPKPITHFVDDDQVCQYSDVLKKRIDVLSNYVNKLAGVYSLGHILPTATWGKYHPMSDRSKELCNPATNEPVVVWIIGHLVSSWFEKDGVVEKQASVTVAPLSNELRIQTMKLLAGFSVPRESSIDAYGPAIRAIKWQTSKKDNNPVLFASVYDAREVLRAKNDMETLSPIDLKKNDLVLLEAKLTHYRVKDSKMDKWGQRTQLEMLAISLLHRPSCDKEETNDDETKINDLWI